MIVLAAAIFCAAFLPAVRFGERQLPSTPPPLIETPDARGAVHILAPAGACGGAGVASWPACRKWAPSAPPRSSCRPKRRKRSRNCGGFPASRPSSRPSAGPPMRPSSTQSFAELDEQLTAIAVGPATSPALKDAALRLRRALALFMAPQPADPGTRGGTRAVAFRRPGAALDARWSGLPGWRCRPSAASIRACLRRFVSEQGIWRIEVMPRERHGRALLRGSAAARRAGGGGRAAGIACAQRDHSPRDRAGAGHGACARGVPRAGGAAQRHGLGTVACARGSLHHAHGSRDGHCSASASMRRCWRASAPPWRCSSPRRCGWRTNSAGQAGPAGAFGLSLRAALLPPLALAGAVGPLALSSRPSVAEVGAALAMLLLIAALLSVLLVPAMARWLDTLMGRSRAAPSYRRC